MFEQVLQKIHEFDQIIIHRHTNPDGDALGSQIGLKHILLENFPGKQVLTVGDDARHYSFMDDSAMDDVADEAYAGAFSASISAMWKWWTPPLKAAAALWLPLPWSAA